VQHALNFLQRHSTQFTLKISSVAEMELLVGCRNKTEQRQLERFLRPFSILKLNEAIADQATALIRQYRLSHGLAMPDALVAATALVHTIPLATGNQRDFRFIAGLVAPQGTVVGRGA
jgi:predicted nucleic acid-binding protein